MKKYAAFLRGININGKNKVAMPVLKQAMEQDGYRDVITYLNSGNILFTADRKDISVSIHHLIAERFQLDVPVYVIPVSKLQDILDHAPSWWGTDDPDWYDNLIFILTDESSQQISQQIGGPTEGLERVQCYENVIFWTFDRKKYQKCSWWKKTAQQGIGEKQTIRTAGTVRKLLDRA